MSETNVHTPTIIVKVLMILVVETLCAGIVAVVKLKLVNADALPPTRSVKNAPVLADLRGLISRLEEPLLISVHNMFATVPFL